ncbi:MAG: hypothetical protein AMJ65_15510, partial [Phycisphaerae bacterium SG8_4]
MKTGSTRICPSLTLRIVVLLIVCAAGSMDPSSASCLAANIEFNQSAGTVDTYDFVEVTLRIANPSTDNPFADISVRGWFRREG